MWRYLVRIGMTRYASGPVSTHHDDESVSRPPRTVAGFALFALFPVALVLAVTFPLTAVAAAVGAALATLPRRLRTARRRTDAGSVGVSHGTTRDV